MVEDKVVEVLPFCWFPPPSFGWVGLGGGVIGVDSTPNCGTRAPGTGATPSPSGPSSHQATQCKEGRRCKEAHFCKEARRRAAARRQGGCKEARRQGGAPLQGGKEARRRR